MDIKGLATGIGSLPHTDIDKALDLIFKYTPQIPGWPQLPKRDIRERMVIQYSQGLPCLRLSLSKNDLFFDFSTQEEELAKFYEHIIADDREYFKISQDYAAGLWQFLSRLENENLKKIKFIKGQITGPFTFAASINDSEGRAIMHNPIFLQAICEGLAMKALWQVDMLKKFKKPIIIFLDEPYLVCLGSGFTPINRDDVIKTLNEITGKIKSAETLVGIHCCGNTDWSIFTEIKGIDIISFDAFGFLERILLYAEELGSFFKRGGILAWGIVPTEAFSSEVNVSVLVEKIKSGIEALVKKGIDKDLLEKRLIITPSCGLGALGSDKAELIFKCLAELSSILKTESI